MSFGNEDFSPLSVENRPASVSLGLSSTRRKKGENKSRFNEKQVKLLESIFKAETKIEPMKKVQLSEELGLEPRQVAIWFQNRRARWKSKQLEKEFHILKVNYENLASLVGSLKEENHSLHLQVQNLRLAHETHGRSTSNSSRNAAKAYDTEINFLAPELLVQDYPSLDELGDIPQASTDHEWHAIDATYMLNQSCCSGQWLHFWNC